MILNEYIVELLKLQREGKGEYKMRGSFYSDEWDITEPPIVFEEEQEIFVI